MGRIYTGVGATITVPTHPPSLSVGGLSAWMADSQRQVDAAQRETDACRLVLSDALQDHPDHGRAYELGRAHEREECAKIVEAQDDGTWGGQALSAILAHVAETIRGRSMST